MNLLVDLTNRWCQLLCRFGVLTNWILVTPPHDMKIVGAKDDRTLLEVYK